MLRIVFFLAFSMGLNLCFAQQKEVDSLLTLLSNHNKEDTVKLVLLNEIAYAYSMTDPQKGLQAADNAIELAQKLNDTKKLASAYSSKGGNYWASGNDSMALQLYQRALSINQTNNNPRGIAVAYNNIGLISFNLSDYVQALEYHLKSLRIFEELKDSIRIPDIYVNVGVDYQYLSDYPKALDYYLKGLKIAEKAGNKKSQATASANIGLVYKNISSYMLALQYQQKTLALHEQSGNKQGVASTLGNIGVVYNVMGKYDTALAFYQRALVLNKEIGNKRRIASDLANIGIVYKDVKDYASALTYLQKALATYEELKDKNSIAIMLIQLGNVYSKAPVAMLNEAGIHPGQRFSRALYYQNRALQLSQEMQAIDRQSEAWQALSETYEANHDFAKALAAYKNHALLRDSITGDEKKQDIMQKTMQYNFEKKEDSIRLAHENKLALEEAEIRRQKTVQRSVTWGGVILLSAALISFIFYKRIKDAQQQQKEAELKSEIADTEMKALRAQMNPHFIFNSLNSISDYIAKNEHEKADEYLTRFAKLIRKTLENSEKKLVSLADDLNVLELYMQLECRRLRSKFDYRINVAENIDKDNTLVPPMILQPFVENSIWHGIANKEGKGHIEISIDSRAGMLHCLIDDDGIGRKAALQVNPVAKNHSMGMKITRTRIDIMNKVKKSKGTIELSDLANGMRVQVSLPFELSF